MMARVFSCILMALTAAALCLVLAEGISLAAQTQKPEIFVQTGHTAEITSVAFSGDGKYLVSGSYDNTVKLWDIAARREIRTFKGHSRPVTALAFFPDGRRILSGGADGIRIWDVVTGKVIRTLAADGLKSLGSVAFSADAEYALSTDAMDIRLWKVSTGEVVKKFPDIGARTLAFSPDGKCFLVGNAFDGNFQLWDIAAAKEIRTFKGHTEPKAPLPAPFGGFGMMPLPATVKSLAFSPDGKYALSGSRDQAAKLWDLATGEELGSIGGHASTVGAVAFSPDGSFAAAGSERTGKSDATLTLWDTGSGKDIVTTTALNGSFACVAFSRDGRFLVAGDNKILRLWDTSSGKELEWQFWYAVSVDSAAFSPDGKHVVSGYAPNNEKGSIYSLWDMSAGSKVVTITGSKPVAFSPDGRYFLSGLALFDASTGSLQRTFAGHSYTARQFDESSLEQKQVSRPMNAAAVGFSSDGGTVLSWGRNAFKDLDFVQGEYLKSWDVATGQALTAFTATRDTQEIASAVFSPDGKYALTAKDSSSPNDPLTLWDVATGKEIRSFGGNSEHIRNLALSADLKYALTWDSLNDVYSKPKLQLWDLATGAALRAFSGHSSLIESAAFSPDARFLLSASLDGTVKLWSVASGKEIRTFAGHTGYVGAVAFAPDGKHAVSGGDSSTRLWDIATGKELATMINFVDGEWIVITPEGYYNSSQNGHKYLNIRLGNNVYGIDQFYDVFYRPDIVTAKIRGEEIGSLVTVTIDEAVKHPPPRVEFSAIPKETDAPRIQVCYRATSTGGGIGEVRLFQNGKLIKSDGYYREAAAKAGAPEKRKLSAMNSRAIQQELRGLAIRQKNKPVSMESKPKGNSFQECIEVETVSGENEISVTAFNAQNSVQSSLQTASFKSSLAPEEPHLYILAVGIDRYRDPSVNLKYAVKDAKDFSSKLPEKAATIYKPENIHVTTLSDLQAGKSGILAAIEELSGKVKQGDGFIFFNASHGVLLENQYYIVSADFDGNLSPSRNLISSNEIVEMSKKIRSLSQLFIFDTCHAGGIDNIVSGLYDARMSVLAKKMGLHIYASAGSVQAALDGYEGNGLFTHTLLQGIENGKEVDKDHAGTVTVKNLGQYTKEKTAEISTQLGHPQMPFIINFGRDNPLFSVQ